MPQKKSASRKQRRLPDARRLPRLLWQGLLALVVACAIVSVGSVALLRFVPPPASAFMVLHKLDGLAHGHNLPVHYQWVPWAAMSKEAPLAMVAGEDQRFPLHHGFDFAAIQKAIAASRDGARLRGASTISQQTAKNLFLWNGRSWLRKGLEAYFTVLLETLWPKHRILEVYANIAEFGDGIYGVGAASRRFFDTDAANLTTAQASLLAAALPNPRVRRVDAPSSAMRQRAAWIRQQMRQLGGVAYVDFQAVPTAGVRAGSNAR